MGKTCDNNMASFSSACVLSILVLVAILHASSAYPTSVDDDNMVYAEWLKQENSKQGDSRSSEANQGSQFSIRAHRRSGAGSGSGSGSGTPPPPPPPPPPSTPTPPPTAAATSVAASTVVATSPTVKQATQAINVNINGNAANFNSNTVAATAKREATCCGIGVLAGTMTQTDGVCAHKTGTNTQCAAADVVARRGAVVITVTYTVDSAVASITLTTVVQSTNTMTLTTLTDAIAAVIAANPTWQGSVTAPTITAIQVATLTTPAAASDDDDNTGVIVGAVIGAIVGIAIIAGIAFFVMKKNSNPSPAKVEPFDQKVGVRAQ